MEWILTTDKLPETDDQVACLVCRHREFKSKDGTVTKFLGDVHILVFNQFHQCWDQEDGDDYECDINGVYCWMYLPEKPDYILPEPPKLSSD